MKIFYQFLILEQIQYNLQDEGEKLNEGALSTTTSQNPKKKKRNKKKKKNDFNTYFEQDKNYYNGDKKYEKDYYYNDQNYYKNNEKSNNYRVEGELHLEGDSYNNQKNKGNYKNEKNTYSTYDKSYSYDNYCYGVYKQPKNYKKEKFQNFKGYSKDHNSKDYPLKEYVVAKDYNARDLKELKNENTDYAKEHDSIGKHQNVVEKNNFTKNYENLKKLEPSIKNKYDTYKKEASEKDSIVAANCHKLNIEEFVNKLDFNAKEYKPKTKIMNEN